ncbi:MAG: ATP-dependent Clp protease adapter ClpS [Arenicella sp.]
MNIQNQILSTNEPDHSEGALVEVAQPKLKKPPLYKVILLNDDYTPMEFVVAILQDIFRLSEEESVQVMLHVHQKGVGICGVYTREIAETKVELVMQAANNNQHPLQCTMEPDADDES